ncbi:hypothetical protein MMC27_008007 [Xylographa pallens]|nr:hypothetical protein [Xylographa pallens]
MSARSAESNHKSSTAEYERARGLTKTHVDLGRWTGDSSENGVDKSVETPNEEEPTKQKDKETEQKIGGEVETEKKDAEAEPTPPPTPPPSPPSTPPPTNPMRATPSRPFPRRKCITETKADGDRGQNRVRDRDGYVEGSGPVRSFALILEMGLGL